MAGMINLPHLQLESGLTAGLTLAEQLFDHLPETVFFVKDLAGRYLAVNQSLVDRCGVAGKAQLIGRHVREIFPPDLARHYAGQDEQVIRTGRAIIEHLELHWQAHRRPGWCLTTKIPVWDEEGKILGVMGISRDLRSPGESAIPATLARALEHLENHFSEPLTPGRLAKLAGLPPVRFARHIKRIFRLTPHQLILQTRLAAAVSLLTETKRSLADIAHACGFYDHSAMTRVFRSATNLTPTQFRALKTPPAKRGGQ